MKFTYQAYRYRRAQNNQEGGKCWGNVGYEVDMGGSLTVKRSLFLPSRVESISSLLMALN